MKINHRLDISQRLNHTSPASSTHESDSNKSDSNLNEYELLNNENDEDKESDSSTLLLECRVNLSPRDNPNALNISKLNSYCKIRPYASVHSLFLKGAIESVLSSTVFFLLYAACCLLTPGQFSDTLKTSMGWILGVFVLQAFTHLVSICKIKTARIQHKILDKKLTSFLREKPSFSEVYSLITQQDDSVTETNAFQKHGLFLFMYGFYALLNLPTCWVFKDVGNEAVTSLNKNILVPSFYSQPVFPQAGWIGFGSNLTLNGYCGFSVLMTLTSNRAQTLFLNKKLEKYKESFKDQRLLLLVTFLTSLLSASPFFLLPFDDPSLSYSEQLFLAFTSAAINAVNNCLGSNLCIEYGEILIKKFHQLNQWLYQQLTCYNHFDKIDIDTHPNHIQLTNQFFSAALQYMQEDKSNQQFFQTLLNFIKNTHKINQTESTVRYFFRSVFNALGCISLLTIAIPYFYVVMDQVHQKILSHLSFRKESPSTFLLSAGIYLPFFTLIMKLGINTVEKNFNCFLHMMDSLRHKEVDLYASVLAIPDFIIFLLIATSASTVIALTARYREEKLLTLFIEALSFKGMANIQFWITATVNGVGALALLHLIKAHSGEMLVSSGKALSRGPCPSLGNSLSKLGNELRTRYQSQEKKNVKVGRLFFQALEKLSITSVSKQEIQELANKENAPFFVVSPST